MAFKLEFPEEGAEETKAANHEWAVSKMFENWEEQLSELKQWLYLLQGLLKNQNSPESPGIFNGASDKVLDGLQDMVFELDNSVGLLKDAVFGQDG